MTFLILDQRSTTFHRYRGELSIVAAPIQFVVDAPVRFFRWLGDSMSSHQAVLTENAKLRAHEFLLEAKLQKLLSLEKENAQLRELLSSSVELDGKETVGQLLAVDMDPLKQIVIADKGSRQKVYQGQPVMDAFGVMGQVVEVGPYTSKIMLLTDRKSAIPVQDARNSLRAIVMGDGVSGKLILVNVPDSRDVQVGDKFQTSGFGLKYPIGYPVGQVTQVLHQAGLRFAEIILQPAAHFARTQQILFVWPNEMTLSKKVQAMLSQKKV